METALAVLLTMLAFMFMGDDEDEGQNNSINVHCINADAEPDASDPALDARASTSYSQYRGER